MNLPRTLLLGGAALLAAAALCVPSFDPHVTHWLAVPVPPKERKGDRAVWNYATSYSKLEWAVFTQSGQVRAQLDGEKPWPGFGPTGNGRIYQRVDDGWLIEANRGEWGGTLYWYSLDGKRHTKVSDDQVTAFFRLPDGLYAVEGLAHLSISVGTIIRVDETVDGWKTTEVAKLPAAPYAASVRRDGTAIITLSDGVVSFGADHTVKPVLKSDLWFQLYPNSSALSSDGQKLYIGMRQFVGEVDLNGHQIRLLVPSMAHLNRLPADDARSVRATYGAP